MRRANLSAVTWLAAKTLQIQAPSVLPTGFKALDRALPDGGFPRGQVIEFAIAPGTGMATSLALWTCRAAQQAAIKQGDTAAWCAFVDPAATLYAPAVLEAGVDLQRLLVVRPPAASITRTTIRLAEANAFSVIAVDTTGDWEQPQRLGSQHWVRVVRRLALAIQETHTQIFLITNKRMPRALPLPVALRVELARTGREQLEVKVTKDKRGRISEGQCISLNRAVDLSRADLSRADLSRAVSNRDWSKNESRTPHRWARVSGTVV
jgi:recombination protein RecA